MNYILAHLRAIFYFFNSKIHIRNPLRSYIDRNVDIITRNNCHINVKGRIVIKKNSTFSANEKGRIIIGNNCHFGENCMVVSKKNIEIGDAVIIGPSVCIYDHNHNISKNGYVEGYKTKDVKIGNHVWIGANVTILAGSIIGDNCVIAAGTVVKGMVPNNVIAKNNRELIIKELY